MTTTYLITGINRGIGFKAAQKLAQDPKNVVIGTVRNESKAKDVLDLGFPNIKLVYTDMANSLEQMQQDFKDLPSLAPNGIDVFIHNAAVSTDGMFQSIYEHDLDNYGSTFDINVTGAIRVYKIVYPHLIENKSKLVFVSSLAGTNGDPFYGVNSYGTSKAALNHVIRQIARETPFTTIAYYPGLVDTDLPVSVETRAAPELSHIPVLSSEKSGSCLVEVTAKLTKEDNAKFINYEGTISPW